MSKTKIILALISFLVFAVSACNTLIPTDEVLPPTVIAEPTIPPQNSSIPLREADVPRVELEIAKAVADTGAAIIVDVRSKQAYDESHIPGAINILLGEFETNINGIPLEKDQWIITYCTWQNEHTSARAAFLLLQNGYTNVTPILGGFQAWVEAGYPLEP